MFETPKIKKLRREYDKIRKANGEVLDDANNPRWTEEFWRKWWPQRVDREAGLLEQIVAEEKRELARLKFKPRYLARELVWKGNTIYLLPKQKET